MKPEDFRREPCTCPECIQAGVSTLEQVRDPQSGRWLCGYPLKRWYEAKAQFESAAARIFPKGMP